MPQPDAVAWSETVRGLSGRLRAELEDLRPGLRYAVHLELRNHSTDSIAVIDQPDIRGDLRYSSGHRVGTSALDISGPVPEPQWAVIPRDGYLGIRIDMRVVAMPRPGRGVALLALGGKAWHVGPGQYVLHTSLTCPSRPDGPENQWAGELELPPLLMVVSSPPLMTGA